MDLATAPLQQQKGIRGLWFKAKVAFNFKKGKAIVVAQPQAMTQSTQPSSSKAPEAVMSPETQEITSPQTSQTQPGVQQLLQQIVIEADTDDAGSPPSAIPIIEVDMTPEQITDTILAATQDAPLDPKGEAFRRYQTARAVFEKYGIPFDENSWDAYPKSQVERIHKAPRMRVRYTCHQCKTLFGHVKICIECTHERCKKCSRHPPRRKKSKILRDPEAEPVIDVLQQPGGACHECQTAFAIGVIVCENCQHQICERCLEEVVANLDQHPLPELNPATNTIPSTIREPIT